MAFLLAQYNTQGQRVSCRVVSRLYIDNENAFERIHFSNRYSYNKMRFYILCYCCCFFMRVSKDLWTLIRPLLLYRFYSGHPPRLPPHPHRDSTTRDENEMYYCYYYYCFEFSTTSGVSYMRACFVVIT